LLKQIAYQKGMNAISIKYYSQFLYAHPSQIVPIIGTTKFERISEAKKAMEIELKREDFYKLWTASTGKEVA